MTIIAPADNFETRQAIHAVLDYPHPVYVRFGKAPQYHLHAPDTTFTIGKAIRIRDGHDLTFIACGETVSVAVAAADVLAGEGLSVRVLSMHTLKPLDEDALAQAAQETRALVTVEEHSVYGGLGEACAAVLMQRGFALPFKIVAIPDEYTVTGNQTEIFNHYGISPVGLAATARQLVAAPLETN
jgi:transketolase